jgi:hypothetical protein
MSVYRSISTFFRYTFGRTASLFKNQIANYYASERHISFSNSFIPPKKEIFLRFPHFCGKHKELGMPFEDI